MLQRGKQEVVEVKSFYGTTVVRLRTDKVDYAMTFGNFIMGHTVGTSIEYKPNGDLTLESSVLIHEYGHYLQSLKFGPINYMKIGLNSKNHNMEYDPYKEENDPDAWAERDASLRGLEYFRALNYSTNGFGENTWSEDIEREYWTSKFWFL